MDTKRFTGIVVLIAVFIVGCSGTYGIIRKQTGAEEKVTIEDLRANWGDYLIYYGMRSNRYADAVMFDPKDNGNKLEGDSWTKIEDQETLNKKIEEIQSIYSFVKVHIIEGANDHVFGYMYYSTDLHVPVKIVDERTLYVSTLPRYKSTP